MHESPLRSLMVLLAVVLVCSVLVSVSAINLRPVQLQNELIERYRNVVALTGLATSGGALDTAEILSVVERLDVRVADLESGRFVPGMDPDDVDPANAVPIPSDADLARLGRRGIHQVIYLVWDGDRLSRLILPIHGQGMWSTLRGFIALESDLNTIAALTFYEQEETAGLGDQIEDRAWQARWSGRRLFSGNGEFRLRVAAGVVDDAMPGSEFLVDGLSGATITGNAVTALVRFWFGPYGYGPLLKALGTDPPVPPNPDSREI